MQSPQLHVADQRISSPVYVTMHKKEEQVSDHQFHFLTNGKGERESFMQELFSFGEKLKRKIQNSYPDIRDTDLQCNQGTEDEALLRLQKKTGKEHEGPIEEFNLFSLITI